MKKQLTSTFLLTLSFLTAFISSTSFLANASASEVSSSDKVCLLPDVYKNKMLKEEAEAKEVIAEQLPLLNKEGGSLEFTEEGFINREYYGTSWGEVLPIKDRQVYNCKSYQVIEDRLLCALKPGNKLLVKGDAREDMQTIFLPLNHFQLEMPYETSWRNRLIDFLNNSNQNISFVRLDDLTAYSPQPGQVLIIANGKNLGQMLIGEGYAFLPPVPYYISLLYYPALYHAIDNKKGLWNPELRQENSCPEIPSTEVLVEKVF